MNFPIEQLATQLDAIRTTARAQLEILTGQPANECKESYLFRKDIFCGVRFCLGGAEAVWNLGDADLVYRQNGQPIDDRATIKMGPAPIDQRRAA